MDSKLLILELLKVPSPFDNLRGHFDKENAIPAIGTLEDIKVLRQIQMDLRTAAIFSYSRTVNISIMDTHSKILKPYVNKLTDEDDFI
jgi:hypothetical protein